MGICLVIPPLALFAEAGLKRRGEIMVDCAERRQEDAMLKLLIEKKRDGAELADAEIRRIVEAYVRGDFAEEQMAAFAMAVCCRGMTEAETAVLTDAMRESGETFSWDSCPRPVADKHSTGGVGDKISFVTQPLAVAAGLAVPSLSGRGLGITGGTVDKLESIPGFRTAVDAPEIRRLVCGEPHLCICSQTPGICPADRKLYALRDVTGTVASIPLITASILSKKLAEGASTLVFDVKCGSGAFMKTRESAEALARSLVSGAERLGRRACALVTPMDAPLGRAIGNSLEMAEALEVLDGAGPDDVRALSVELAARMVHLSGAAASLEEAREKCAALLADGSAARVFRASVAAQGGDLDAFARMAASPVPHMEIRRPSEEGGRFVASADAGTLAETALLLGAGRAVPGQTIDLRAGIVLNAKPGEEAAQGALLATLYASDAGKLTAEVAKKALSAFAFSGEAPQSAAAFISRPWLTSL